MLNVNNFNKLHSSYFHQIRKLKLTWKTVEKKKKVHSKYSITNFFGVARSVKSFKLYLLFVVLLGREAAALLECLVLRVPLWQQNDLFSAIVHKSRDVVFIMLWKINGGTVGLYGHKNVFETRAFQDIRKTINQY